MYKIFEQFDINSFQYINDSCNSIVPQSVYMSDKAHIHQTHDSIAIDFIKGLHEPVLRYQFNLSSLHAFGNGRHPTTYMCLALLAETLHIRIKKIIGDVRMLDVGTGTGILAIAAHCMGVGHIDAFDASVQAYECALQNSKGRNNINLSCCDIESFTSHSVYDCVTANLMTSLILKNTKRLSDLLSTEGYLIVSGILDEKRMQVITAFGQKGLTLKDEQTSQGWFAGVFQKV